MIISRYVEKRLEKLMDTLERTEGYDHFVYNTNDVLNSYLKLRERLDNMISDYYDYKKESILRQVNDHFELKQRIIELEHIVNDNFTKLFKLLEVKEKTNE